LRDEVYGAPALSTDDAPRRGHLLWVPLRRADPLPVEPEAAVVADTGDHRRVPDLLDRRPDGRTRSGQLLLVPWRRADRLPVVPQAGVAADSSDD
jgi:hypothetical protein